jgi:hypothetical protein
MTRRLTPHQYAALCQALAAGRRHVEIARSLEISPWTIARVADDLRRQGSLDPPPLLPEEGLPDDSPPQFSARQLRRCPGCGGMVYLWPCLACQMATARPQPAPERPRMLR